MGFGGGRAGSGGGGDAGALVKLYQDGSTEHGMEIGYADGNAGWGMISRQRQLNVQARADLASDSIHSRLTITLPNNLGLGVAGNPWTARVIQGQPAVAEVPAVQSEVALVGAAANSGIVVELPAALGAGEDGDAWVFRVTQGLEPVPFIPASADIVNAVGAGFRMLINPALAAGADGNVYTLRTVEQQGATLAFTLNAAQNRITLTYDPAVADLDALQTAAAAGALVTVEFLGGAGGNNNVNSYSLHGISRQFAGGVDGVVRTPLTCLIDTVNSIITLTTVSIDTLATVSAAIAAATYDVGAGDVVFGAANVTVSGAGTLAGTYYDGNEHSTTELQFAGGADTIPAIPREAISASVDVANRRISITADGLRSLTQILPVVRAASYVDDGGNPHTLGNHAVVHGTGAFPFSDAVFYQGDVGDHVDVAFSGGIDEDDLGAEIDEMAQIVYIDYDQNTNNAGEVAAAISAVEGLSAYLIFGTLANATLEMHFDTPRPFTGAAGGAPNVTPRTNADINSLIAGYTGAIPGLSIAFAQLMGMIADNQVPQSFMRDAEFNTNAILSLIGLTQDQINDTFTGASITNRTITYTQVESGQTVSITLPADMDTQDGVVESGTIDDQGNNITLMLDTGGTVVIPIPAVLRQMGGGGGVADGRVRWGTDAPDDGDGINGDAFGNVQDSILIMYEKAGGMWVERVRLQRVVASTTNRAAASVGTVLTQDEYDAGTSSATNRIAIPTWTAGERYPQLGVPENDDDIIDIDQNGISEFGDWERVPNVLFGHKWWRRSDPVNVFGSGRTYNITQG